MPINEPVTFVVFCGDLASHALQQLLNIKYTFPRQTTPHRRAFHKTIGEAAMIFRDRHAEEFALKMAEAKSSVVSDVKKLIDYFEDFVEDHFKGRVPLMEVIVFCAFLVDLVVCCADNGRTDLVDDVVAETYEVYSKHVKPYFDVAGGWMSLLRIAKDYLGYVESLQKYSLLFDVENNAIEGENDAAILKKNAAVSESDDAILKKNAVVGENNNAILKKNAAVSENDDATLKKNPAASENDVDTLWKKAAENENDVMNVKDPSFSDSTNVEENISCDKSASSLRCLLLNRVKPGSLASSEGKKNKTFSFTKLFNDIDTEYMKKLSVQTSQIKYDSDEMSVSSNEAVCLSSENTLLANLLSVMQTSVASIKTSNNDANDSFLQALSNNNNASVIETADKE